MLHWYTLEKSKAMTIELFALSAVSASLLGFFLFVLMNVYRTERELKSEESSAKKEKRKGHSIYAGYTSSKT